nr:MAG TPA: holin [Caudoviricetes sp.]
MNYLTTIRAVITPLFFKEVQTLHITLAEFANQYYELFNDIYIHALAGIIVFDIITGLAKAWVTKTVNSTIGRRGLIEHLIVLVLVVTVYPYLIYIGFEEVATAFIFFFIATYGVSLIENLAAIGVPFPKGIKKRLEKLRDALNEKE